MQAVIAEEPKIWEEGERQVKLGAFLEEMGREKKELDLRGSAGAQREL